MARIFCFIVCILIVFTGCKNSSSALKGLVVVEGTVTLDGNPLERGLISFVNSEDTGGKQATIKDGKYRFSVDQGVKPGECVVRITSTLEMDRNTKQKATGETLDEDRYGVELIPEAYNKKTELTATVTEAGPNKLDFELDSKKK